MTKKCQKNADFFECKLCDFKCSKESNMSNHLLTLKHKRSYIGLQKTAKKCQNLQVSVKNNICSCGKQYKFRQGLWKHKQTCKIMNSSNLENSEKVADEFHDAEESLKMSSEVILSFMQQNEEFKKMLLHQSEMHQDFQKSVIDVLKSGTSNIVTNTTTTTTTNHIQNNTLDNSHKTFNLQVFLNETCKDAMNITDFVNSIQLQLTDFVHIGEVGYVNGISNIIIKNLKMLDEHLRPVHCSDLKRERIYIKENDKWEKDTEDNEKLKRLIKLVAYKNTKMIPKYREKYPECQKSTSKLSDIYSKMVIEAMGGSGNDDDAKASKIIKRIAKEILIDKYD